MKHLTKAPSDAFGYPPNGGVKHKPSPRTLAADFFFTHQYSWFHAVSKKTQEAAGFSLSPLYISLILQRPKVGKNLENPRFSWVLDFHAQSSVVIVIEKGAQNILNGG